jgi:hypothetical protein
MSRAMVLLIACAVLAGIDAHAQRAEDLGDNRSFTLADGRVIETNKASPSTRLIGAAQIWVRRWYGISTDCSPPPGCYAKRQLVNYHFGCAPRFAVVVELISMDLNGNVVKQEVLEQGAPAVPDFTGSDVLELFCGSPPDPADLRDRMTPNSGNKPGKR